MLHGAADPVWKPSGATHCPSASVQSGDQLRARCIHNWAALAGSRGPMRVRRNPVELCVSRQVGLVRSLSGKETRPATKMSSRTSTVETKVSRIRHEDVQSNTEMSGALLLRHSDELADAPNQRWQVAAVQRGPPRRMWSHLTHEPN